MNLPPTKSNCDLAAMIDNIDTKRRSEAMKKRNLAIVIKFEADDEEYLMGFERRLLMGTYRNG
ncbi:unnamed protein product [Citrullus colocynthis]|uniref:Uncharacterized protein n=1 Tax=Citrullus colocynthis TaxID=252529 RepID=A0ABP0XYD5_9ROSI